MDAVLELKQKQLDVDEKKPAKEKVFFWAVPLCTPQYVAVSYSVWLFEKFSVEWSKEQMKSQFLFLAVSHCAVAKIQYIFFRHWQSLLFKLLKFYLAIYCDQKTRQGPAFTIPAIFSSKNINTFLIFQHRYQRRMKSQQ